MLSQRLSSGKEASPVWQAALAPSSYPAWMYTSCKGLSPSKDTCAAFMDSCPTGAFLAACAVLALLCF